MAKEHMQKGSFVLENALMPGTSVDLESLKKKGCPVLIKSIVPECVFWNSFMLDGYQLGAEPTRPGKVMHRFKQIAEEFSRRGGAVIIVRTYFDHGFKPGYEERHRTARRWAKIGLKEGTWPLDAEGKPAPYLVDTYPDRGPDTLSRLFSYETDHWARLHVLDSKGDAVFQNNATVPDFEATREAMERVLDPLPKEAIRGTARRRRFHEELTAAEMTLGHVSSISSEEMIDAALRKLLEEAVDDNEKRLVRRFTDAAELHRRYLAGRCAKDKAPFRAVFAEIVELFGNAAREGTREYNWVREARRHLAEAERAVPSGGLPGSGTQE